MLNDIIFECRKIKTRKKDLRNFGLTIRIILLVIVGFLFFKEIASYKIFAYTAVIFIGLGLMIPIILKPIYIIWMVFAVILGWIMTRVILSMVYYFIITPIGIIIRLLGMDFLELKTSNIDSYWNARESKVELNQDYEKQF